MAKDRTFRDKTDDQDILDTLADIARELEEDLERSQYAGKTITVKFKVSDVSNGAHLSYIPLRTRLALSRSRKTSPRLLKSFQWVNVWHLSSSRSQLICSEESFHFESDFSASACPP